jgi:hypothetical protein
MLKRDEKLGGGVWQRRCEHAVFHVLDDEKFKRKNKKK